MLRLVVLLICLPAAACLYSLGQTDWDATWTKDCFPGYYIRRLHSYHSNSKEDRRWTISCEKSPVNLNLKASHYTPNFVNNWDAVLLYGCPNGGVVTGIASMHDNRKEDRRYRIRCTPFTKARILKNCRWTGYINNMDGLMDYMLPQRTVIRGLFSYHNNNAEDRQWRLEICNL